MADATGFESGIGVGATGGLIGAAQYMHSLALGNLESVNAQKAQMELETQKLVRAGMDQWAQKQRAQQAQQQGQAAQAAIGSAQGQPSYADQMLSMAAEVARYTPMGAVGLMKSGYEMKAHEQTALKNQTISQINQLKIEHAKADSTAATARAVMEAYGDTPQAWEVFKANLAAQHQDLPPEFLGTPFQQGKSFQMTMDHALTQKDNYELLAKKAAQDNLIAHRNAQEKYWQTQETYIQSRKADLDERINLQKKNGGLKPMNELQQERLKLLKEQEKLNAVKVGGKTANTAEPAPMNPASRIVSTPDKPHYYKNAKGDVATWNGSGWVSAATQSGAPPQVETGLDDTEEDEE